MWNPTTRDARSLALVCIGLSIALAAGKGAAAGAGLTRALFDTGKPDAVQRGFVEQCLKDLGYQTSGWR